MKKINKLFLVAMLCLMTLIGQTMNVAQATDEEVTGDLIPEEEMQSYSVDLRALASNQEAQDILPFPITLRDFRADYVLFEPKNGDDGVEQGFVTLDPETKKPVFTERGIKHLAWRVENDGNEHGLTWDSAAGYNAAYNTAVTWYENLDSNLLYEDVLEEIAGDLYKYVIYHANHLFEDVDGLNEKEQTFLTLTKNPNNNNNMYEYIDGEFFPLDDKLFGSDTHSNFYNKERNYHFTLESHTQFYFGGDKDLEFTFTGDDDVWAFIGGYQVIDLGGVHWEAEQKVKIECTDQGTGRVLVSQIGDLNKLSPLKDSNGNEVILEKGWHDFDFFFMERRTDFSNLKITTNMEFNPGIELEKIAYLKGENDQPIELKPESVVYPGQTIYYKFRIKNVGNIDLKNIVLQDNLLNLNIDSSGVSIKGQPITDSALYEIQIGKSIDEGLKPGDLTVLNYFPSKYSKDNNDFNIIEISSDLFAYVVTDDDVDFGKVVNEAIVAGFPCVAGSEEFTQNSLPAKFATAEAIVGVGSAPLLTLTKQVINPVNKDDLFTIQVQAQDSGGEVFNVRLKAGESVTLPVKYGVTYTIKEIVPMNYTLKDMSGDINANYEVVVTTGKPDYDVVITNEVTNTKWFQFKKRVVNYVAKVMSGEGS